MKTFTAGMAVLAVLAAITMVGSAFAGQTQAEREMADLANTLGWEARVAMETGSVPVGETKQRKSEDGAKTEFPTVETGGTVYRIGIDTF